MFSALFNRSGAASGAIDHDAMVEAVKSRTHTLVDVRETGEFRSGTIKGAIHVPLSAFDPSRIPAGKPVVVFCATGGRSGMAAQMLKKAGRTDVVNYRPGITGWRMQGQPLV